MVIRTIHWAVGDDLTVTPTKSQFAGVQGDHEVTRVTFSLPLDISKEAGNGAYIEFMSASGAYDKTDNLGIEYPSDDTSGDPATVTFLLPQAWTQEGGQATIRLVLLGITDYPEDKSATAYTFEGKIHFEERQEAVSQVDRLIDVDIDRLMKQAKDAVSSAVAAVERADAANQNAEQALETAISYVGEAGWCMDEAKKSADAAAGSASAADGYASAAAKSAEQAVLIANEANARSVEAQQHAENAQTASSSAEQAGLVAQEAADRAAQSEARINEQLGDLESVLDELHVYAQTIINGGAAE